jgi:hypothetical protein
MHDLMEARETGPEIVFIDGGLSDEDPPHVVNIARAPCNKLVDDQMLNCREMHLDVREGHQDRPADRTSLVWAERENQVHPDPGFLVQQRENIGSSYKLLDRVDRWP